MIEQEEMVISDIDFNMCGSNSGYYRAGGIVRQGKVLKSSVCVSKFKFMRGKSVPMECWEPEVIAEASLLIQKKAQINASIKRSAA